MGRIDDQGVHPGVQQGSGPVHVSVPAPDGRRHPEATMLVLARVGELAALEDVLHRDEPPEPPLPVHHRELLDPVLWRIASASSRVVPTGAVMSRSPVMTAWMGRSRSVSNCRSRFVTIPTSRPVLLHDGDATDGEAGHEAWASRRVARGPRVMGFRIIPLSERLTRSTSPACMLDGHVLVDDPDPPSRAMAMAMRASVTVSMAAEISGICRGIDSGEEGADLRVRGWIGRMTRNQEHVVEGETFPEDAGSRVGDLGHGCLRRG
jgi:hypothetical protein